MKVVYVITFTAGDVVGASYLHSVWEDKKKAILAKYELEEELEKVNSSIDLTEMRLNTREDKDIR